MRVIACFAASLDGKIASAPDPENRIGSQEDLQHLLRVRDQADAILVGGETFRQFPRFRRGTDPQHRPLQCILTRSIHLSPEAPLFSRPEPVVIYASCLPAQADRQRFPETVEWVSAPSANPVPAIIRHLEDRGVNTLLVEGGGQVFNLFLEARAVEELYLTLCPLLLAGGEKAPGLVSGPGFRVKEAPRTKVLAEWRKGDELYLHLRILYP